MNTKRLVLALIVAGAIGVAGYGVYRLGVNRGTQMSSAAPDSVAAAPASAGVQKAGDVDPTTGKKVLYWHDPMVPGQKFDKPGKSPFMDMQLVPVYADGGSDEGTVAISSRVQQNLGVRTAEVKQGALTATVEAVGSVAYNERDVAVVQARSNGYLERLYVRAPLDPVRRGQPLADLYVPDWVAAQEEYLSAKRIGKRLGVNDLAESAAQRMRLAGMSDEQIRTIEAGGKVQPRLTITAPIGGVVGELTAREGMTVMAGAPLFRLNGLSTVWVNAGTGTVCYEWSVTDAATPIAAAHIHHGAVGVAGPVVVPLPPTGPSSGIGCVTGVDRGLALDIIRHPSDYYINTHNAEFPTGAARGQLSRTP